MHIRTFVAIAACAFTGAVAAQNSSGAPQQGTVITTHPVYTQSMHRLQDAAQQLRESIQAMAQRAPGPERDLAIAQAHQALLETQTAMMALPPELRAHGTVSTADYDASVRKLMAASDELRAAVQEMAQKPAGPRLNLAIQRANRALWDTQVAMASAYDPRTPQQRAMAMQ